MIAFMLFTKALLLVLSGFISVTSVQQLRPNAQQIPSLAQKSQPKPQKTWK